MDIPVIPALFLNGSRVGVDLREREGGWKAWEEGREGKLQLGSNI